MLRNAVVAGLVFAVLGLIAAPASAERPFAPRFADNAAGNIVVTGNTLMTCPAANLACAPAQQGIGAGTQLSNNAYVMERVDADSDATTFTSSSADLVLPAGARVLFAGLYYGGRVTAGTGGTPALDSSNAARATVKLAVPGGGYQTLGPAATVLDNSTLVGGAYAAFLDVTAQVAAAGAGTYAVADVQAGTGNDRYAGWALVVAYEHPSEPARNLSVFDGLQTITAGSPPVAIPVSGFRTPPTGPVRTSGGFVAYEGDRGSTGDAATLNGQPLQDASNPPNNFFNSTISQRGIPFTSKAPNFNNQLGFDADLVTADGYLANGATSATLQISTAAFGGEQYLAHVIAFATELFAPRIEATKSVANVTNPGGPARPGDVLRYTATFTNTGGDAAAGFVAADAIPAGTELVPGSLRITAGPNAPATPTDARFDDLAELDGSRVVFRLGAGATATEGGVIAIDGSATIAFDVRVTAEAPAGGQITNIARADFRAEALGTTLSAESAPATIPVVPFVDVAVRKLATPDEPVAGGQLTYTIVASNAGPSDATAVTVDDLVPEGLQVESLQTTQGACDRDGRQVSCALGTLPAGGAAQIVIVARVGNSLASERVTNRASARAAEFDLTPGDNEDDVATRVGENPPRRTPRADLAVTKTADLREVGVGSPLNYTITVRNDGPDAATGVEVTDTFAGPVEVLRIDPSQGRCRENVAIRCALGRIAAGRTATIALRVRPLRVGPLANGVSVAGARVDRPRGDNLDVVRTEVLASGSRARVRVSKSAADTSVRAGGRLRYRIVLRSIGPDTARELSLCDRIPRALVLVRAPGARVRDGRACWTVGELAAGQRRTFTLTVRATIVARTTRITNTARVRGVNFAAAAARSRVRIGGRVPACPAALRAC